MNSLAQDINREVFLKRMNIYLFVSLLLMVACFFTWSENVAITRLVKVVGRMGVMFSSVIIYRRIIHFGAVDSLCIKNKFSSLFYLLYLLLGFASFLWSTNVGFSALQWFMTFQSFVFSFFFIKSLFLLETYFKNNTIQFHRLLGNSVFVLVLIFVIGMFVNPDTFFRLTNGGEESRLGGYLMNPNELGMLCGVGIACLVMEFYHDKNKFWIALKLCIIFFALYMTGSRSSLIGALLIIWFHLSQSKNKKLKWVIIFIMLLVVPVAVNKIILKDGDSSRLKEVMSMTGRLPFWTALINEGLPREPMLGFGFMRIDYKEYFQSTHTYQGKMTHNTFMQVLMNLGFIGFTLVLFQLFFTVRGLLQENKHKKMILFGVFIPIVINSFTEFGIFGESNYGILFFQLLIFSISFSNRTLLTKKEQVALKLKMSD
jgi:hypothetical protein